MATTVKVIRERTTVELLLWKHGKRRGQSSARLTQTLQLNPGLAALGPVLPLGTVVTIPDLPPVTERPHKTGAAPVSLFD